MRGTRGPIEGSTTRLNDGRLQARITLDGGTRKAFFGTTRAEADANLTAALRDRDRGLPVLAEMQTVGQDLASWQDVVQPTFRPRTWTRYRELLTLHAMPTLGKVPIARLTARQVQQLYSSKIAEGLSTTNVHLLAMVLHRALGYTKVGITLDMYSHVLPAMQQ